MQIINDSHFTVNITLLKHHFWLTLDLELCVGKNKSNKSKWTTVGKNRSKGTKWMKNKQLGVSRIISRTRQYICKRRRIEKLSRSSLLSVYLAIQCYVLSIVIYKVFST